ncbi:Chlorophyllase type 0 [Bienertia sinuspersici]
MAALWVSLLILTTLAIFHHSKAQLSPKNLLESSTSHYNPIYEKLDVFQKGKYQVTNPINVKKLQQYSAPEPLLIISPKEAGFYPVLFFIHGTMILNQDYSELFKHIASHGYIVVAPKLFDMLLPSEAEEIEKAALVLNWLPSNLQTVLQHHVNGAIKVDLQLLAVSGHSRGGKSAFALALGMSTTKISALIGVDPVAGRDNHTREEPYVLTYKRDSFNISFPVTVIGTGLGSSGLFVCAPANVSHHQFFEECKDGSHFVITKYGHMQMLNDLLLDPIAVAMSGFCKCGFGLKSTMRRTLGGIMVAFLDTYFKGEKAEYFALMDNPSLAPTSLIVEKKGNIGFALTSMLKFSA